MEPSNDFDDDISTVSEDEENEQISNLTFDAHDAVYRKMCSNN